MSVWCCVRASLLLVFSFGSIFCKLSIGLMSVWGITGTPIRNQLLLINTSMHEQNPCWAPNGKPWELSAMKQISMVIGSASLAFSLCSIEWSALSRYQDNSNMNH